MDTDTDTVTDTVTDTDTDTDCNLAWCVEWRNTTLYLVLPKIFRPHKLKK